MKKTVLVLISLLCLFTLFATTISAEDDSKTTTITYTVDDTFEWSVTPEITAKDDENIWITISKWDLADTSQINISVESTANNWQLVAGENKKVAYKVVGTEKSAEEQWENDTLLLTASGEFTISKTHAGIFYWVNKAPEKAGIYQDNITFVASISKQGR